jgi:uncharacterized membrane protein
MPVCSTWFPTRLPGPPAAVITPFPSRAADAGPECTGARRLLQSPGTVTTVGRAHAVGRSSQTGRSRLRELWRSFWLIPAACAAGAVLLAVLLLWIEVGLSVRIPIGLSGNRSGVQSLLSAIITSMISFTALVFTITVVVLQLASSQFSPRVLRTFLEDRITQATLGSFVATFVFAMVALATLPAGGGDGSSGLAVAVSMALVLVSVGVFILFIREITRKIRVAYIVMSVGDETRRLLERRYPVDAEPPPTAPEDPVIQIVGAPGPGVLSDVDSARLLRLAIGKDCRLDVSPAPGEFLPAGAPLLVVRGIPGRRAGTIEAEEISGLFTLSTDRTMQQDVAFGFRQLADVAQRALSPAVNDPTTAIQAVDQVHDLLRRLATRPLYGWVRTDDDGRVRVVVERVRLDRFLAIGIDDIAHSGLTQPRLRHRLISLLDDLRTVVHPQHVGELQACRDRLVARIAEQVSAPA